MAQKRKHAIGYIRTSSAANVGEDKDSDRRQRLAIERFAKRAGYDVVDWFADEAVSGADPVDARPGFSAALARIAGNGEGDLLSWKAYSIRNSVALHSVGPHSNEFR